jgi:hypothetical protein
LTVGVAGFDRVLYLRSSAVGWSSFLVFALIRCLSPHSEAAADAFAVGFLVFVVTVAADIFGPWKAC